MGTCPKGTLSKGDLVQRGPCPKRTLSKGDLVQRGPCPKRTLSKGDPVQWGPCQKGILSKEDQAHRRSGPYLELAMDSSLLRQRFWFLFFSKLFQLESFGKVNHFFFGHVFSWRRRRSRRWEKISLSSWIFLASSKTTLLTRMSFERVEKRKKIGSASQFEAKMADFFS